MPTGILPTLVRNAKSTLMPLQTAVNQARNMVNSETRGACLEAGFLVILSERENNQTRLGCLANQQMRRECRSLYSTQESRMTGGELKDHRKLQLCSKLNMPMRQITAQLSRKPKT